MLPAQPAAPSAGSTYAATSAFEMNTRTAQLALPPLAADHKAQRLLNDLNAVQ